MRNLSELLTLTDNYSAGVDAWWTIPHLPLCHTLSCFSFHMSLDGFCDLGTGDIHGPIRQRARVLRRVLDQLPLTLTSLELHFEVCTWAVGGTVSDLRQIDWKAFGEWLGQHTSLGKCVIRILPSDEVGDPPLWTSDIVAWISDDTQVPWQTGVCNVSL